jgi:hypothetical protein
MGHHNLSRRCKLREALRRSWGRVEKNFELSTTTTAGLLPVPTRTSAITRTITRSKGQMLQAPPSQWAKFWCYKTHESSNMAVAVRRTPFTNPRALRVQHYIARRDPTMYMQEQWPRSALTESREPRKS